MTTTQYTVTGMTCGHCENAVRTEVSALTGVTGVEVSAASGTLVVSSDSPVADESVLAAVSDAGYEATRA